VIRSPITPEQIDELLPQTQCGLCTYGGCMPYAEAMVFEQAPIHLCPPGGVKTLKALGELLEQDPTPYIAEMEEKAKPPMLAVIREAECIGCTKCIQACPVDAIIGTSKQMHSIITDQCTGCELCVSPCPVDCIDMVEVSSFTPEKKNQLRERFNARQQRLAKEKREANAIKKTSKIKNQSYVLAAIERAKAKKNHHS
jgi:electron transport complex protein RnfB